MKGGDVLKLAGEKFPALNNAFFAYLTP